LGLPGFTAKSSISLFMRKPAPAIVTPEPNHQLRVVVGATALPSTSTTAKCVVWTPSVAPTASGRNSIVGVARSGRMDDLFGHAPLRARFRALLDAFADDTLQAGRYDMRMGRKLAGHLERSGFAVSKELTVDDAELSFHGAATVRVIDAWRARFDRMTGLHAFCGAEYEAVRDEFLDRLGRADHESLSRVYCTVATWPSK
jgi:hypothetical protein